MSIFNGVARRGGGVWKEKGDWRVWVKYSYDLPHLPYYTIYVITQQQYLVYTSVSSLPSTSILAHYFPFISLLYPPFQKPMVQHFKNDVSTFQFLCKFHCHVNLHKNPISIFTCIRSTVNYITFSSHQNWNSNWGENYIRKWQQHWNREYPVQIHLKSQLEYVTSCFPYAK